MDTIVVATDGSRAGSQALAEAIDLARALARRLLIVTIWRPLQGDFGLPYTGLPVASELVAAESEHAELTLAEAKAAAERAGLEVETVLRSGDPATEICRLAEAEHATLLVIGSHGHGVMLTVLLGSVSSAVLQRATCPVVVVRAPDEAQETPADAPE